MPHLTRREAIVTAALGTWALTATPAVAVDDKPTSFEMASADTKRTYKISVDVPRGTATAKHPVVYLLDAQWEFDLVRPILGSLAQDHFIPETILVGIAFSGDDQACRMARVKDFTPTPDKSSPGSGDGPKFRKFLRDELLPRIERDYSADPARRVLVGWSFGGLFTLDTLFDTPEQFSSYVAISPSLYWDDGYIQKRQKQFATGERKPPKRLFLSMSEFEPPWLRGPFDSLTAALKGRDLGGLKLAVESIAGERHFSGRPKAYAQGLRHALEPALVPQTKEQLARFVGSYASDDPAFSWWGSLTVELEGDKLVVRRSMRGFEGRDEIFPIADDDFRARRGGVRLRFTVENKTNRMTASAAWDDLPVVRLVRSK